MKHRPAPQPCRLRTAFRPSATHLRPTTRLLGPRRRYFRVTRPITRRPSRRRPAAPRRPAVTYPERGTVARRPPGPATTQPTTTQPRRRRRDAAATFCSPKRNTSVASRTCAPACGTEQTSRPGWVTGRRASDRSGPAAPPAPGARSLHRGGPKRNAPAQPRRVAYAPAAPPKGDQPPPAIAPTPIRVAPDGRHGRQASPPPTTGRATSAPTCTPPASSPDTTAGVNKRRINGPYVLGQPSPIRPAC